MADVAYPFGQAPAEADAKIVEVLELALARARAGLVSGVMVATVETSGMPATAWHYRSSEGLALIGAAVLTLDGLKRDAFAL